MSRNSKFPRSRVKTQLGLALAAALASAGASAHVGETVPYRWTARLHMSTTHGHPNWTDTVTWKVPVATFQGAYDDSRMSPLAVALPAAPDPLSLTPLTLTVPDKYHPVCVADPYIRSIESYYGGADYGDYSATQSYLCDRDGRLKALFGSDAASSEAGFRSVWRRIYGVSDNCIAASISFSSNSVTVTVPGHSPITVSGVTSGAGTISLPDFWYMGNVPSRGGGYLCPEGSETWTCESAGAVPSCEFHGLQDAYDRAAVVLPLTLEEIREVTAKGHATLAQQVSEWFEPVMKEQQLGVAYFSYLMSNVVVRTGGTGLDYETWPAEPAEVRWTTYMDNTALSVAGTSGRNMPSTYGQTQVRRLFSDSEVRYLYCRYGSGTMEFLPPTWGLPDAGYLSCAAFSRDVSMPTGSLLSENIFFDASQPDTERGLNLLRAYDDTEYLEAEVCPATGCLGPFDGGGIGHALIQEHVVPAMGRWAAEMAILDYSSAARVSEAELSGGAMTQTDTGVRMDGSSFSSSTIRQRTEANVDAPDEYGEVLSLMKYGMSWQINNRSVSFPSCEAGPIRMGQRWSWDAENSLAQLRWDVYRTAVDAAGTPLSGNVESAAAHENGGGSNVSVLEAEGRYRDWATERTGVPVPFAAALWVPYSWMTSAIYLYNDYYYPNTISGLSGSWISSYYPPLKFNVSDEVRPSGQFVAAPYIALDPYNYPSNHPGYYRVVDARDSDIVAVPTSAPAGPLTLNHAFLHAPYSNGTVSGNVYQTRNVFNCREQEEVTVCVRYDTREECSVVDGVETCTTVTYCAEDMTYMACTVYDCRRDFCSWPMETTGPGAWSIEIEKESCAAHSAVKAYLDRGWLPPASANGAQDAAGTSGDLLHYVAAQERAAIDANERNGYRASGISPTVAWGGHGSARAGAAGAGGSGSYNAGSGWAAGGGTGQGSGGTGGGSGGSSGGSGGSSVPVYTSCGGNVICADTSLPAVSMQRVTIRPNSPETVYAFKMVVPATGSYSGRVIATVMTGTKSSKLLVISKTPGDLSIEGKDRGCYRQATESTSVELGVNMPGANPILRCILEPGETYYVNAGSITYEGEQNCTNYRDCGFYFEGPAGPRN